MSYQAPLPLMYQPRKLPPFRYRARLRKALAFTACGVLGVLAGIFGDLPPAFTLGASLATFAACVAGVVNLRKLF